MRSNIYPSNYLALLANKYDLDLDEFFNALIETSIKKKSSCGSITIELRDKEKSKLSILIRQGEKFVAQFHIHEEFLCRTENPIKNYCKNHQMLEKKQQVKQIPEQTLEIIDLRIGMKNVNVKAKIKEISDPTSVITRYGNYATVANATIQDNTGNIKLCLWNDQIKSVKVGDTIEVKNAQISQFKREKQMRIGKKGSIQINKA